MIDDLWNSAEDGTMHLTLQKRNKGLTWSSPILGQGTLDPLAADTEQKRLMLQRFQEEVSHISNFSIESFTSNCNTVSCRTYEKSYFCPSRS